MSSGYDPPPTVDPHAYYLDARRAVEEQQPVDSRFLREPDTRTFLENQRAADAARAADHPVAVRVRTDGLRRRGAAAGVIGGGPIDGAIATLRRTLTGRRLSEAQRAALQTILDGTDGHDERADD
ncbi:hypothetical protein ACFZB6_31115 [Streptomyces syringium]|uniref:hypothetical protein n=1 Tax=Streptomyces syringium TaxID=76729 RepID=UPI0036E6F16B